MFPICDSNFWLSSSSKDVTINKSLPLVSFSFLSIDKSLSQLAQHDISNPLYPNSGQFMQSLTCRLHTTHDRSLLNTSQNTLQSTLPVYTQSTSNVGDTSIVCQSSRQRTTPSWLSDYICNIHSISTKASIEKSTPSTSLHSSYSLFKPIDFISYPKDYIAFISNVLAIQEPTSYSLAKTDIN